MNNPGSWKSWEGRVVDGRFPLRQWLGGSDHSAVFLTDLRGPDSPKAAIKLIAAVGHDADRKLSRWRAAAKLSHAHLIRLFEMGRTQIENTPLLYLVMECAEEDLSQILPQRPLTTEEAAELLPPALDALSHLHEKGFVHGHLAPSNVHAVDNQLKLSVDRAAPVGEPSDKTWQPDAYDAPETATEPRSPAADMWSLGVTLIAALTQRPPGYGQSKPANPVVPETVPQPFSGIARECLRSYPNQRCTIPDVRARLQSSAAGVTSRAVPAASGPRHETKRTSWGIIASIAVVLVLAAVFVWQKLLGHHDTAASGSVASKTLQTPAPESAPASPSPSSPRKVERTKKDAVSSGGEVARQVLPDIPKSARNTIQGRIRISARVTVDSSGKVTEATLPSAGPSPYFAKLVLKAAQQWEFSAPQVNGQPVPSVWTLRFQLKKSGTEAAASRAAR